MSAEKLGAQSGVERVTPGGEMIGNSVGIRLHPEISRVVANLKWRSARASALAEEVRQLLGQDSTLGNLSVKVVIKSQKATVLVQGFGTTYDLIEAVGFTLRNHLKVHGVIVRVSCSDKRYELILELGNFGLEISRDSSSNSSSSSQSTTEGSA